MCRAAESHAIHAIIGEGQMSKDKITTKIYEAHKYQITSAHIFPGFHLPLIVDRGR